MSWKIWRGASREPAAARSVRGGTAFRCKARGFVSAAGLLPGGSDNSGAARGWCAVRRCPSMMRGGNQARAGSSSGRRMSHRNDQQVASLRGL